MKNTHKMIYRRIVNDQVIMAKLDKIQGIDSKVELIIRICKQFGMTVNHDEVRAFLKRGPGELSDSDLEMVVGGKGNTGGSGDDSIIGGIGSQTITGGDGDDTLFGGSTAREHDATGDNDAQRDAQGHDYIDGGAGNDHIYGGDGNDTLIGGTGNDLIRGNADNDELHGGDGNDVLYGGDGNDELYGDEGSDSLYGGDGNDELHGGDGNDVLHGGDGRDILTGGQGQDIFAFDNHDGTDIITDFNPDEDQFHFSDISDPNQLNVTSQNGSTLISYGDTTILVEGVELTAEEVWKLSS